MGKSEKTIEEIIDHAISIIAKNGLHELTFQNLANKSGISRQMVHRYFSDREEILCKCFERVRTEFQQEAVQTVIAILDPLERLKGYVEYTIDWMDKNHAKATVFISYFQLCLLDKKMQRKNVEFVDVGTLRIAGMLQAIKSGLDNNLYLETAKMIQNFITGTLLVMKTEDIDAKKLKQLSWKAIQKLIVFSLFLIVFGSISINPVLASATLLETSEDWTCQKTMISPASIPEAILYSPGKLLLRNPEFFDGTEVEVHSFVMPSTMHYYDAFVHRKYHRHGLVTHTYNHEIRLGPPSSILNILQELPGWPLGEDGRKYNPVSNGTLNYPQFLKIMKGLSFDLHTHLKVGNTQIAAVKAAALLYANVLSDIEPFVRKHYRRRAWPKEFVDDTLSALKQNNVNTTLIQVKNANNDTVATFAIMRAPYGTRKEYRRKKGDNNWRLVSDHVGRWGELVAMRSFVDPLHIFSAEEPMYEMALQAAKSAGRDKPRPIQVSAEKLFEIQRDSFVYKTETFDEGNEEVRVEWGAGEVIEPKIFIIDPNLNADTYINIYFAFWDHIASPELRPEVFLDHFQVVTFNDRPALYYPHGLKRSGKSKLAYGIHWEHLQGTGRSILETSKEYSRLRSSDRVTLQDFYKKIFAYYESVF